MPSPFGLGINTTVEVLVRPSGSVVTVVVVDRGPLRVGDGDTGAGLELAGVDRGAGEVCDSEQPASAAGVTASNATTIEERTESITPKTITEHRPPAGSVGATTFRM